MRRAAAFANRSGERRIFLVALTGWGQDEDRARTREAGFDHHLVKPVEAATLVKLLASLPCSCLQVRRARHCGTTSVCGARCLI